MKRMSNLTDKFDEGITLFTQMIMLAMSFLVEKKYKNLSSTGSWFLEDRKG